MGSPGCQSSHPSRPPLGLIEGGQRLPPWCPRPARGLSGDGGGGHHGLDDPQPGMIVNRR